MTNSGSLKVRARCPISVVDHLKIGVGIISFVRALSQRIGKGYPQSAVALPYQSRLNYPIAPLQFLLLSSLG